MYLFPLKCWMNHIIGTLDSIKQLFFHVSSLSENCLLSCASIVENLTNLFFLLKVELEGPPSEIRQILYRQAAKKVHYSSKSCFINIAHLSKIQSGNWNNRLPTRMLSPLIWKANLITLPKPSNLHMFYPKEWHNEE